MCGSGKRALPPRYNNRGLTAVAAQADVAGVTLAASGVGVTGMSMDAVAAIPAVGPPLSRLAT